MFALHNGYLTIERTVQKDFRVCVSDGWTIFLGDAVRWVPLNDLGVVDDWIRVVADPCGCVWITPFAKGLPLKPSSLSTLNFTMHLLHHGLSHYFSKAVHHLHSDSSVLFHTSSLDEWPSELVDMPDRFVDRIESCSAHTMTPGHDGCSPMVDKEHYHTFLRVTLAPSKDHPEETIFVERVLMEQDKAIHSVTPISADEAYLASSAYGDTLHDHACVILDGFPSSLLHTHHVHVDRAVHFSDCPDRQLSLYELATLVRFVSLKGLRAVSISVDTACEAYSRWFCRATLSALAPDANLSPGIICGVHQYMTPHQDIATAQVEIGLKKSVNAWLMSTFKEYPKEEVESENLTRQLNAMNDEEREKKVIRIKQREAEKDREGMFREMDDAMERARNAWEEAEGNKGMTEGMEVFQAMIRAGSEVQRVRVSGGPSMADLNGVFGEDSPSILPARWVKQSPSLITSMGSLPVSA